MSRTYVARPRKAERWTGKPKEPNAFCQKTKYADSRPHLCSAPTVGGKQYCDKCYKETLTGGDRKSPEQAAPKVYAWANDQLLPRKRA